MTTYNNLTPAQQAIIQAFMTGLRPLAGQLARTLQQLAALDAAWQAGTLALINSLDAGAAVNDATGLAGAQVLVKEEVLAHMTNIETILSIYGTAPFQQAFVKAAGINAIMP